MKLSEKEDLVTDSIMNLFDAHGVLPAEATNICNFILRLVEIGGQSIEEEYGKKLN